MRALTCRAASSPACLVVLSGLLVSCSSANATSPPPPPSPDLVAFSRATNLIPTTVTIDGTSLLLAVDTGSPFVVLNPSAFPGAPSDGAAASLATLTAGPVALTEVEAYGSAQIASPDPSVSLGGLLGCNVICLGVAYFDYQGARFALDEDTPPAGLQPPSIAVPFSLLGGGDAQVGSKTVSLPKSRIIVSVAIEGAAHTMLVDTGASDVTVRSSVFSTLTHDGRATLSAGHVETVSGSSTATMTRVRSIAVGGVEVDDVVVLGDPATDALFDTVGREVGRAVDGSLGGTFLDHFYLTVDYASETLTFARYADTSFIIDPGERLGFLLARTSDGSYEVASVTPGTDAASQGVHAGDSVVAIDGTELKGISVSDVIAQVSGAVGTPKAVTFGPRASLAGQTVSLQVSELLPLP